MQNEAHLLARYLLSIGYFVDPGGRAVDTLICKDFMRVEMEEGVLVLPENKFLRTTRRNRNSTKERSQLLLHLLF